MGSQRIRGASARLAAVAIAAVMLGALSATPAYAGNWMQAVCVNPNNSIASNQGWAPALSSDPQLNANAGFLTPDPTNNPNDFGCMLVVLQSANPGDTAAFQYTPPATSTVDGGYLIVTTVNSPLQNRPFFIPALWSPEGSNANVLWNDYGSNPAYLMNEMVPIPADPGGPDLYAGLYVGYGLSPGIQTCLSSRCTFSIESGGILLQNVSSPTGSGFSGSLLSPGAHGTADVDFTASDPGGPGVYQVTVLIDGTVMYQGTPNTNGGECASAGTDPSSGALIFDYQQPCPTSESVDVPVDTTGLADGVHQLQVKVMDVAQNTSTVIDTPISTANRTTPSSAGSSSASAALGSGPVYAFRLDAVSERVVRRVMRRSYTHSGFQFSGVVLAPSGAPAPGVNVTAQAQAAAGGGFVTVASAMTDGTGRFVLSIPRGTSRAVDVVAGGGVVAVKEVVTPGVSLVVRSKPGGRLVFTGRVRISPLGTPRPLVTIANRASGGWQPLGTVRVGSRGAFRYVYHASALLTGYRFAFRASTPASVAWDAGSSAIRKAVVR